MGQCPFISSNLCASPSGRAGNGGNLNPFLRLACLATVHVLGYIGPNHILLPAEPVDMSLGVDRVCVIIARTRHKMVQIELDEAVNRGARFIELRLDFFARAVDFKRLLPHKKCPWVATLRRHTDGGRWKGTEEERQMILRQAIVAGFDWVDLETDFADEIKRFRNVKRIVSYHNFVKTPDDLEGIYERMTDQDADVLKIVTMAEHPSDCMRVLNLIKNAKKPTVGHCLGEMGLPSRILSLRYGAPFLFAAFNKERGIAPGLPSLEEVKRYFHVDDINAETKVYGVLGDPVSQSFSPALHNLMFRRIGMNAIYLPFRVPRGELVESLQAFAAVPVSGYSVTIPHKEPAAALAVASDERVRETGAANTLVSRSDGFHAYNTDYEAALEGVRRNMPVEDGRRKEIKELSAMVLGTGGVARAVAHALHRAGQVRFTSLAARPTRRINSPMKCTARRSNGAPGTMSIAASWSTARRSACIRTSTKAQSMPATSSLACSFSIRFITPSRRCSSKTQKPAVVPC